MTTTRFSLENLPEELLLAILSHISNPPTLANLSLTSSRLHRLSLPSLYHTFPGQNSDLFLRTTSHHPALAAHTKTAAWRHQKKTLPRLSPLEKQHITNRLNELCVPHPTDLAEQFSRFGTSDEYWFFEMLLLFLPGVQEMHVGASWLWDDHHYWFKSLSPFFNPLRRCANTGTGLKRVSIEGPMRIENVVPLLGIPTLTALDLSQVTVMRREGYCVFQWSVWPVARVLPVRSSRLQVLALRESYVDAGLLLPVIRGIRALTSFTYEHVPNDLADEGLVAYALEAAAMRDCLAAHRESLEHVRIRDEKNAMSGLVVRAMLYGEDTHCPETPFTRLKTLDVGPLETDLICGPEQMQTQTRLLVKDLPASLQVLRVQISSRIETTPRWPAAPHTSTPEGDVVELEHSIGGLLRCLAYALADAKRFLRVEVVDWNPSLGWFPDDLPVLQSLYTELGLELKSIGGDAAKIYGAEPLLMDDESEEGWVVVTDLHLAIKS